MYPINIWKYKMAKRGLKQAFIPHLSMLKYRIGHLKAKATENEQRKQVHLSPRGKLFSAT